MRTDPSPLEAIIRAQIAQQGSISVAEYMELALGHPEYGYYQTRDPLGLVGDFTTAPEISQIFGEMIGIWCVRLWQAMGRGPLSLVELGPGRGTLMADLLRASRQVEGFHAALTIHMLETSPVLAHAQYITLRHEHPRIEWLSRVEELPPAPSLVIANEFFDALPIRQFVMAPEGLCERRITLDAAGALAFTLGPPGLSLAKSGQRIAPSTIVEQCPLARQIMKTLAARMATHGGAMLAIDYGYLGDAHHDTLQAVRGHAFASLLADPGQADITAHVDFSTLMRMASDAGIAVLPLMNQGEFLARMGAPVRLALLCREAAPQAAAKLSAGLERLMSPQAMGELFKVMMLASRKEWLADFAPAAPSFP